MALGGLLTGVGAGFYLGDSRSALEGPVPGQVKLPHLLSCLVVLEGHPRCFAWVETPGGEGLAPHKSFVEKGN